MYASHRKMKLPEHRLQPGHWLTEKCLTSIKGKLAVKGHMLWMWRGRAGAQCQRA